MIKNLGDTVYVNHINGLVYLCTIVAIDNITPPHYLLISTFNVGLSKDNFYVITKEDFESYIDSQIKCDPDLVGKAVLKTGSGWAWWASNSEFLPDDSTNTMVDAEEDRGGLQYL